MTIATAPPSVFCDEPPFLTFLKLFAASCVVDFGKTEFEGKINWRVVFVNGRTCIRFDFVDLEHKTTFDVYLAKRYYAKDMLRVVSPDIISITEKVMEADTSVFLAYLTY